MRLGRSDVVGGTGARFRDTTESSASPASRMLQAVGRQGRWFHVSCVVSSAHPSLPTTRAQDVVTASRS